LLVYLVDLRHKTITLTPDASPLGIGFLGASAIQAFGTEVQVKLFAYPEHLFEELKHTRPDVLAVTNYCWNYALQCHTLRYARSLYPELLTLMGGPNIALDHEGQETLIRKTPCLDLYVIDEGEAPFVSVLSRYLDSGQKKAGLFTEPIPSSIFIDQDSLQVVRGAPVPRMRQLNDVPSPYLMGLMDQFFDGAFSPMIQTNRGCPFTCTFCVEGVNYMTKVNKFSSDRVQEELEYIAHHARTGSALMISDSNFGMLPGDLDTARSIRQLQDRVGWPKWVWGTTGKNNKEAILLAIDILDGTMSMTNSVQSMDSTVLTNIKRTNIKLETYASLQQEVKARNRQSYAEVIVALPGETRESFMKGVCQLLDSGVAELAIYQLMLLDGTEVAQMETRDKFAFETKYRVLSRDFGMYEGEPVIELEEIVVASNTFSMADYMECRKLQLILQVYHREGIFREILEYLNTHQVPISVFVMDLLDHLHEAPEEVQSLVADYVSEAAQELFNSPEEARHTLAADYHKLASGEVGGNLQQKYSAIAWFTSLGAVVQYAIQRAEALVTTETSQNGASTSNVGEELATISQYLQASVINIRDMAGQFDDMVVPLAYDIESWAQQGYRQPLSEFRNRSSADGGGAKDGAVEYVFYVPESHRAYLSDKLQMFGASDQGLGALVYRVSLTDLRRPVKPLKT